MSKKLFFLASGILLSVIFIVPSVQAASSCRLLSGVSGYAYASELDSGVMDFDYGDYADGAVREDVGSEIADENKVCVASAGTMAGYAWNTNGGWLQMNWCLDGVCSGLGQAEMDPDTGYWAGYAWSDHIGWVWFDWTCSGTKMACPTTQRVHTNLTTGALAGYAWNDRIGWINFGDGTAAIVPEDITVIPSVTISPNPLDVTKYGLGGHPAAPFASGEAGQEYVVKVQLFNSDTGKPLSGSDYNVTVDITPTADSFLCYDQIAQTCRENNSISPAVTTDDTEAIFYPNDGATTYSPDDQGWQRSIRSFAPTSNMNGYDKDGNGTIDFYFDIDLDDPDALIPSDSTNKFVLESIVLTVIPIGSAPGVNWTEDPLFNLDDFLGPDDEYTLKFAPAIEVTNLEAVQSDGSYMPYIASTTESAQNFKGIVARWVPFDAVEGFAVKAILRLETATQFLGAAIGDVDLYSFLFDKDGDSDYLLTYTEPSSTDSNTITNLYNRSLPGGIILDGVSGASRAMCPYLSEFEDHTTRFIPVMCGDSFVSFAAGIPEDTTNASLMEVAKIVDNLGIGGSGFSSPRYMTQVIYKLSNGSTVKYRSNYLPQPSSATDYQEDLGISGSVTSSTGEATGASISDDVVVIGDIATITVRNELFRRFSEYTKGVTPPWSGGQAIVKGDFEDDSGKGVELLGGKMLYYKDVDAVRIQEDGADEKTIVVYGGNIFIETDLTDVGLVAFKDNAGKGGNIYILNSVLNLEDVHIFAEGSVFSAFLSATGSYQLVDDQYTDWGSLDVRAHELRNQLYFKGSLVSHNTIFGYQPDDDKSILPNGAETDDDSIALEYDLNQLREFTQCWIEVDLSGQPVDQDGDGLYIGDVPDPDDVEDCDDAHRSENIPTDVDPPNPPVYLEYAPPPSSLPLLGESQTGNLNVFD